MYKIGNGFDPGMQAKGMKRGNRTGPNGIWTCRDPPPCLDLLRDLFGAVWQHLQTSSYRRKCLEQALKISLKIPLWGSSGPEMLNPQWKTRKISLKRSLKRPLLHRDRAQVGMCSGDSDWDVAAPNSPHKRSEKRPLLQMDRALIRVRSGTPALPYHPDPFRPHANAGDMCLQSVRLQTGRSVCVYQLFVYQRVCLQTCLFTNCLLTNGVVYKFSVCLQTVFTKTESAVQQPSSTHIGDRISHCFQSVCLQT